MTIARSLYHAYQRYRTLQTDHITTLPIVILMPHSACNCRCVMCDIWKGNQHIKQITEDDTKILIESLRRLGTRQVVMSGGEALLNPAFFRLCELLQKEKIKISLLSTGLTLKKNADLVLQYVNDIIVSLDGDEYTHNLIRNIPDAFRKLSEGVRTLKGSDPKFPVTGRTVIHRLNFRKWPAIIDAAREMKLDKISFLPADLSSQAFNRNTPWSEGRQFEIAPSQDELVELSAMIENVIKEHRDDIEKGFVVESPEKLRKISQHYSAFHGLSHYPYKKCNAPWVSAVIEPDGNLRPCFFHEVMGNIREHSLEEIINSRDALAFRKSLDIARNETCAKCVCYLNLSPGARL
jgi:Fe-coproporphyrin III synthase